VPRGGKKQCETSRENRYCRQGQAKNSFSKKGRKSGTKKLSANDNSKGGSRDVKKGRGGEQRRKEKGLLSEVPKTREKTQIMERVQGGGAGGQKKNSVARKKNAWFRRSADTGTIGLESEKQKEKASHHKYTKGKKGGGCGTDLQNWGDGNTLLDGKKTGTERLPHGSLGRELKNTGGDFQETVKIAINRATATAKRKKEGGNKHSWCEAEGFNGGPRNELSNTQG